MADKDALILFHVREHFIHAFRNQVQSTLLSPLYDASNAPSSTNLAGLQPGRPYDYENYPTTGSGNMYPNTDVTASNLRAALMSTVSFFRYMRTFRYGLIGNYMSWTNTANGFITDGYSWTLRASDFPGAGISNSNVWTNNDTMLNNQIVREVFNTMLGGVSGPARAILYWDSYYMHTRLASYMGSLGTSANSENDYPDLRVCHASCHSSCHSSAPVVVPTDAPTQAPTSSPTQTPTDAPTQPPTDAPTQPPTQAPTNPPGGGGGGGGGGCVSIHSFLPQGTVAGEIKVGEEMFLADEDTLEPATGVVTYSKTIDAMGFRIVTESGASLVCSDTAPIPVKGKGLVTPEGLLGETIAVRHDVDVSYITVWEKVVSVEPVGWIKVQHITVGDRCFWAGEKKGAYILHHNYKQVPDYTEVIN